MSDPTPTDPYNPSTVKQIAADLPQRIGRYRIEKILGQGGFGIVYLAYDEQLDRLVAIKVPHPFRVDTPELAQSYLAEARTVASLDHPNIVTVHDVGSTDQFPCFIVSKFIEGSTLAYKIKRDRPSVVATVEVIATVAETLHYAHRKKVVHRDIKPGNILLDRSGKPFVADFGLALREQEIGKGPCYAGTPAYMSPEQARGEGHRVDGRSDIFSLGVVLYELLTGQRPFHADSREELLEQIAHQEVRPPRQIQDRIPKELERICLKSLSKRASERYATAKDMGDDLRHFLAAASAEDKAAVTGGLGLNVEGAPTVPMLPPTPSGQQVVRIVPKGLRSFDAADADFFLELLPGPRDRDGVPDSIRFWKRRIETTDADDTFAVGLIYGPSGCGKSSLVKAGLLPRLAPPVTAVYIEATGAETEARLLKGLRRQVDELPSGLGLIESLASLRQGQFLAAGRKVLLVLDQFEQWLHARSREENTELVQALRQCDGGRVQCLVLVRDDFGMAATRFMAALDIPIVQGNNFATVDLFDLLHARKVLGAFGRAYGRLPDNLARCTKDENAFLDQAIAGLAQDGKVISVRLALFAEMVKGKLWTPATLKEVGGAAGVGVALLEETFSAPTANPRHRLHQQAARAVLKALLPDAGTDIKGHRRSHAELLAASGYANQPRAFDDLLRILDSELLLITPSDPEGEREDAPSPAIPAGEPYYQLTHDYLVPSIREWLTRKQKETRRGRAELSLAERGALWQAKPERQQLPSLREWLTIRLLTERRTWSDIQRQMMAAAARHHLRRTLRVGILALVLVGIALFLRGQWAEERAAEEAKSIVRRLLDANISQTPAIIDTLSESRRWADPLLEEVLLDPASSPEQKLRARLALLTVERRHLKELRDSLLEADANDFPVIRVALAPYRADLLDGLWKVLEAAHGDTWQRFRAAAALASYDPANPHWEGQQRWVAEQLVAQPSLVLPTWVEAFKPIKQRLTPALAAIFREQSRLHAGATVTAEVLGDYAAKDPKTLAEALAEAAPRSFAILFGQLQAYTDRAVAELEKILDTAPAGDVSANVSAGRHANSAIALLRLKRAERLWPLLRQSPDPRVRSFLIDRVARMGCNPATILARLEPEQDESIRAALWLILGHFNSERLPAARRSAIVPRLQDAYRCDSSAAVHAATHWLMGQWGLRESQRPAHDDRQGNPADGEKKWYRTSIGQTMVRISGPLKYEMGPLPDEPASKDFEKRHTVRIDSSYDIGMTEVTAAQFRLFLKERDDPGRNQPHYVIQANLAPDKPAIRVSWYDAAAFCNWLSKREGIPRDQWCYEPNEKGAFADGMKIVPNATRKIGYRLPTEAEWEFACRGGAATMRGYGDADELLSRYAWYAANAYDSVQPVARLLPNAYGLFDMHGNTSEWCQDRHPPYAAHEGAEIVVTSDMRIVRGGGVNAYPKGIRSARRMADRPIVDGIGGFRIARSRP